MPEPTEKATVGPIARLEQGVIDRIEHSHRHPRLALCVLVALASVAAACSSSGRASHSASTSPTASSTATGTPTQSAVAATTNPKRGVVSIKMATVGDPGNPSVGVVSVFGTKGQFVKVPANGGVYKNCSDAPAGPPNCLTVGAVDYKYQIGEYEITVAQYVTFLNTVDPLGKDPHDLYIDSMSPTVWPEYGSVRFTSGAGVAPGHHYSVAYPQWADKPFGFANFLRAARFVNSLVNGTVLSTAHTASGGFNYITYKVRLGRQTETGMYDLRNPKTTRTRSTGFVIPSNNEWIKAAYYDPNESGINAYWQYPTGPKNPPVASSLNPTTGNVTNAGHQPLATYNPQSPHAPAGTFPTWCPPQAGKTACKTVSPLSLLPGLAYQAVYQGNLSSVGQTDTPSPWGTEDQGGNVVEWQDTIVPPPPGYKVARVWRRMHGGVANAAAYQMLISAFGFQPQNQVLLDGVYPWFGFRVGLIGDLK